MPGGWFETHETLFWVMGILSVLMFLGTLVGLIIAIVLFRPDHFVQQKRKPPAFNIQHPALRILYLIFKNVIGVLFIAAGLAMLVLPGQGLLSLLVGLSLTNFPRKRRVIRFIVRRKAVLRSANWLRRKFGRPPLQAPK